MSSRRIAVATILMMLTGALAAVVAIPPASATTVLGSWVDLPDVGRLNGVLVDDTGGRVFLLSPNDVYVLTSSGTLVGEVSVPGTGQMALSPDGSQLYVSTPSKASFTVVDTSSLATSTIPAQTGIGALAVVGDDVWYLRRLSSSWPEQDEMRVLDTVTGDTRPGPDVVWGAASMRPIPGQHELLVNEYAGQQVGDERLSVVDTDTSEVVGTATEWTDQQSTFDFSADDAQARIEQSRVVRSLPDLTATGRITMPDWWHATLTYVDAQLMVGYDDQDDVVVADRSSGDLLNTLTIPTGHRMWPPELVDGTLFAIVTMPTGARIYFDQDPGLTRSVLTFTSTKPIVTVPATLSGSLTDSSGTPVSGATVTIPSIGSTTTDADGQWSIQHTFSAIGHVSLVATATGGGLSEPSQQSLTVSVAGLPSSMTLTAPAQASPHDRITLQGHLTNDLDGSGVSGADIWFDFQCLGDNPLNDLSGTRTATTDAGGDFTLTYDAGHCVHPQATAEWAEGAGNQGTQATADTTVSWHTTQVTVHFPSPYYLFVGDTAQGTASVKEDGAPAAGVALTLTIQAQGQPATVRSVTTDASGSASIDFPTPTSGSYYVTAALAEGPDTEPAIDSATVFPMTATSTVTTPASLGSVSVGNTVTLSGILQRSDDQPGGATVEITAQDWGWNNTPGPARIIDVVTDADGHFDLKDTPPDPGQVVYTVDSPAQGARYPASAQVYASLTVRSAPAISVHTDSSAYTAGDDITVSVGLDGAPDRSVSVVATSPEGSTQQLYSGPVPEGGLTLHQVAQHDETISASVNGTARQDGASASTLVTVRASIQQRALTHSRGHGTIAVYGVRSHPRFAATLTARQGACVSFTVQRRTTGGWRHALTSTCIPTDAHGVARWSYTARHHTGFGYRIRTSYAGDAEMRAAATPWFRFRFRSAH